MKKRNRWIFAAILGLGFLTGIYFWKINHTGAFFWHSDDAPLTAKDIDFTVHVGDYLVTREEVDWEYRLYMFQLGSPETGSLAESKPLDPPPARAPSADDGKKPILELYNKIMADLIERKLLFQYVATDEKFSFREPSRYTSCIQEWSNTQKRLVGFIKTEKDREMLKSMLCEKAILTQYVSESVNSGVKISDEEAKLYYARHKAEFVEPVKVVIRQIVLGNEEQARKLRDRVTPQNFAGLARELSLTPESKAGGLLGPFAKGDMPSVFDIAFEMKPGTIQGILKSTYGFHILMLEKRMPRFEQGFEAAKPKIIKNLTLKRQEEDYKKWVESALNTIPIKSSRAF